MMKFSAGLVLCSLLWRDGRNLDLRGGGNHAEHAAIDPPTPSLEHEEPSESPRFLHDEHQTTQGSITVARPASPIRPRRA